MRTTLKRPFLALLLLVMPLLATLPASGAEVAAELLIYRISSPAEEIYLNRLLVTPEFLRLDRGEQDSGYILYDRRQGVVYSADHEERSILIIDPPPLNKELAAQATAIEVKPVASEKAPVVGGVTPQRWVLRAGGRQCREAYVLPGLMSNAVAAYGEYLSVLARQQALALPAIPAEFQDACDNAVHLLAPDALLRKGLPLKVWDEQGYRESLIDFREGFQVPESDFTLPDDYSRMPMGSVPP
jgi:hypothetical protein